MAILLNLVKYIEDLIAVYLYVSCKAFHRVNHRRLFKQLGAIGLPGYIFRILIYWYKNQDMCIRWGDAPSAKLK